MDVRIINRFPEASDELKNKVERALTECGMDLVNFAMDELDFQGAVNTGNLKGSISFEVRAENDMGEVRFGSNVEYAPYVEFGTGVFSELGGRQTPWRYQDARGNWHTTTGMAARPYIKPAITNNIDGLIETIEETLRS